MMNLKTISLLLAFMFLANGILPTWAVTYPQHPSNHFIAVEYSNGCQTAIKNHMKTDCPSVLELMKWDSSDQKFSGHFIRDKDGVITRASPAFKNHYIAYSTWNKTAVCVLCLTDLSMADRFQTIFIEPRGFKYTIAVNDSKTTTIYHDRYTHDCTTVTMDYTPFLMNDTIHYLESQCTKTSFNDHMMQKLPDTVPRDYNDSITYHYKLWLENNLHMKNCITKQCDNKAFNIKKY